MRLPERVGHAHHLLLVLGVLDVRVAEVDDGALDGVALVPVYEHVGPTDHLPYTTIHSILTTYLDTLVFFKLYFT